MPPSGRDALMHQAGGREWSNTLCRVSPLLAVIVVWSGAAALPDRENRLSGRPAWQLQTTCREALCLLAFVRKPCVDRTRPTVMMMRIEQSVSGKGALV